MLRINGKIIAEANSFAYDDCHKFYAIRSEAEYRKMLECGYTHEDIHPISELPTKWAESCSLRFISSADLDVQYVEQGKTAHITWSDEPVGEDEPEGPFHAPSLGDVDYAGIAEFGKRDLHIQGVDAVADNTAHASFAAEAFAVYASRVGEDEFESTLSDLLGDLRHLADALGLDYDDADGRGEYHYDCEINQAGI